MSKLEDTYQQEEPHFKMTHKFQCSCFPESQRTLLDRRGPPKPTNEVQTNGILLGGLVAFKRRARQVSLVVLQTETP